MLCAACADGTGPSAVRTELRIHSSLIDGPPPGWPTTVQVTGGYALNVRTIAAFGCGDPDVRVRRVLATLDVEFRARPGTADRVCPAVYAPLAVEAIVSGLPAGSYSVRVTVPGAPAPVEASAAIDAFVPGYREGVH
jgi:hypothetical protein